MHPKIDGIGFISPRCKSFLQVSAGKSHKICSAVSRSRSHNLHVYDVTRHFFLRMYFKMLFFCSNQMCVLRSSCFSSVIALAVARGWVGIFFGYFSHLDFLPLVNCRLQVTFYVFKTGSCPKNLSLPYSLARHPFRCREYRRSKESIQW